MNFVIPNIRSRWSSFSCLSQPFNMYPCTPDWFISTYWFLTIYRLHSLCIRKYQNQAPNVSMNKPSAYQRMFHFAKQRIHAFCKVTELKFHLFQDLRQQPLLLSPRFQLVVQMIRFTQKHMLCLRRCKMLLSQLLYLKICSMRHCNNYYSLNSNLNLFLFMPLYRNTKIKGQHQRKANAHAYLFTCTTIDTSKLDFKLLCEEFNCFLYCKIIRLYCFALLQQTMRLKHQLHFQNRLLRSPLKKMCLAPLFHLLQPNGCCNVPCTL